MGNDRGGVELQRTSPVRPDIAICCFGVACSTSRCMPAGRVDILAELRRGPKDKSRPQSLSVSVSVFVCAYLCLRGVAACLLAASRAAVPPSLSSARSCVLLVLSAAVTELSFLISSSSQAPGVATRQFSALCSRRHELSADILADARGLALGCEYWMSIGGYVARERPDVRRGGLGLRSDTGAHVKALGLKGCREAARGPRTKFPHETQRPRHRCSPKSELSAPMLERTLALDMWALLPSPSVCLD